MKTIWGHEERAPEQQARGRLQNLAWSMPLRQRIDMILVLGLLAALLIGVGSWFAFVIIGDRVGWFDAPLVQPVHDDRILINVRDRIATDALLDAVTHTPDQQVYISQQGGIIHRYDPHTRLWSLEKPFAGNAQINPNLTLLRSGCGADPLAAHAVNCPDAESLWGVSAAGGLVRRRNAVWQILIPDTTFIGANGKPIQQDQLTTAALSLDKRWLVVGTRAAGIGIYDSERRTWIPVSSELYHQLPALSITHLLWWRDHFWIGTPAGLIALTIDRVGGQQLQAVKTIPGAVVDLDAEPEGALWALIRHHCDTGGDSCLWLGKLAGPDQAPTVLLNERNIYPRLSLSTVNFAQDWGSQLLVAGQAGIFAYNPQDHNWQQRFDRSVSAILPLNNQQGFYFGFPNGVGLLQPDALPTWTLPDAQITKLLYGQNNEVLALTGDGNLFGVSGANTVRPVFTKAATTLDPTLFTTAADLNGTVLLTGPEGVLLHNIYTRTYEDIPVATLPDWLRHKDTQLLVSGNTLYAVLPGEQNTVNIYRHPAAKAATSTYLLGESRTVKAQSLPGPAQQLRAWDEQGIGLLAADGSLYQFPANAAPTEQPQRLTGATVSELNNLSLFDAAELGTDFIVTTQDGLRRYNLDTRTWDSFTKPPADQTAQEIVAIGNQIVMRTDKQRLVQSNGPDPVLIGDADGLALTDDRVSDAQVEAARLYLAGDGQIAEYDMSKRRVTNRWDLPGSADVTLKGLIKGQPLALSNKVSTIGDTPLAPEAGDVLGLSVTGDFIWTDRLADNRRFLMGHPIGQPPAVDNARCFFRNPSAGADVQRILDARELPNGLIAATTNAGLRFYNPAARSWYLDNQGLVPTGGRVYVLNQYLALTDLQADSAKISLAPLNSIQAPPSCSTAAVKLAETTSDARSVTINEHDGRAAWLTSDGAVVEWQNGQTRTLLSPPGHGPDASALRRVYDRSPDYFLLTTDTAIWHYNLTQRRWTNLALQTNPAVTTFATINIERNGPSETVTAKSAAVTFYVGSFDPQTLDGTAKTISLTPVFELPPAMFNASADALLDLQLESDNTWTFLLADRLKHYDPERRVWLAEATLGAPDKSFVYKTADAFDRKVVVGNQDRTWWVAQENGPQPAQFAQYTKPATTTNYLDSAGVIWQLDGNGLSQNCTADANRVYQCQPFGAGPFWLEATDVQQVLHWQQWLLFVTNRGLRAFDPETNGEVSLPTPAQTFTGLQVARTYQDALLLRTANKLLVLQKQNADTIHADQFDHIQALIYDDKGRPWLQENDRWLVWLDGQFVEPPISAGHDIQKDQLTLFVAEGLGVTGVDKENFPYTWNGDQMVRVDAPLPTNLDVATMIALAREREQAWWTLTPNRLQRFTPDTCYRTAAPPVDLATATPTSLPISRATTQRELSQTPGITATATFTQTPSPTPTQTPTATPTPTPTPVPYPCLKLANAFSLPAGFALANKGTLQFARVAEDGNLTFVSANGQSLLIKKNSTGDYTLSTSSSTQWSLTGKLDDSWSQFQANLKRMKNGHSAYNPVTQLRLNPKGALMAVRPTGEQQLATLATANFVQPAPLDVGWLAWERTGQNFIVASNNGANQTLAIPKAKFVVDGHLLFEPVEAVLAKAPDQLYAANPYGIWMYAENNLSLDDRLHKQTITFQPLALTTPLEALRGNFVTNKGQLVPGATALKTVDANYQVSIADVVITEKVRQRTVDITMKVSGVITPALEDGQFLWDIDRRSLAYADGRLYLQSKAGIHPVDHLADFDLGPDKQAVHTGALRSEQGKDLYYWDGTKLYRRNQAKWTADVADPALDRILVDNSTWTWRLQNNVVDIKLTGTAQAFGLSQTDAGLAFTSDRLVAASAHQNQLYVFTEAFFEIASTPDDLGHYTANRWPPQMADTLDDVYFANSQTDLFRVHGADVARWEPSKRQFTPVPQAQNPYQQRPLATTNRLRFTLTNGAVLKEVRVDQFDGTDRWAPFQFVKRQFPFDVVTSLAVYDNELYVGTAAGLQHYSSQLATGLDNLAQLYDLRSQPNAALAAVSRVGIPTADPNLLMVRTAERCMELRGHTPFAPCKTPALLDARLRIQNPFWRWRTDANDQLVGEYLLNNGQFATTSITISQGRFPQDRLTDALVCNGNAYTLWADNWATVFADNTVRLRTGLHNYQLTAEKPERFICVAHDVPLVNATIQRGLYLQGTAKKIWRFENNQWLEVTAPELLAGLRDHADHPPVVDHARLRLRTPNADQPYLFEQRAMNGVWHALPWLAGRVALDDWHEVVLQDNTLWAATPVGIVAFQYRPNGPALLDGDTVQIVREPRDQQGLCSVTDMEQQAEQVLVRCDANSKQVFQGMLTNQKDTNNFTPFTRGDPFAERELVNEAKSGYWQWRLKGRAGGSVGSLQMMLHGEALELANGRFVFDTINSLALFKPGMLESGTDLGGWFRTPLDSFHVRDFKRTALVDLDPTQVKQVRINFASGQQMLCLQTPQGKFIRLAPNDTHEELENCLEYLADDPLWRYERDEKGLQVTAPTSIGGAAHRLLLQGRFSDDTMMGPPITGRDATGLFYLWPTYAGVFRLNQALKPTKIYGPNFPGLPDGATPSALILTAQGTPAYATSTLLYALEEPRAPLKTAPLVGPTSAIPLEAFEGAYDTLQVRWRPAPTPSWNVLRPTDAGFLLRDGLQINVSGFDKFNQKRVAWHDPAPWIELHFAPTQLTVTWSGAQQSYPIALPAGFTLIRPILAKDRLLLIGAHEILEINLARGMVGAFEVVRP